MKKTNASWRVQLNCHCPNCDYYIDILSECFYEGEDLPEVGTSREDHNIEYECPNCKEAFIIEEIEY